MINNQPNPPSKEEIEKKSEKKKEDNINWKELYEKGLKEGLYKE
jgi:hypothetical protein